MVFFTCNACGQAVKKNQVEKHYTFQCRNCQVLSCMDCGKDFHGDEYLGHVKCVSENEKYGGKDYKPKPNANKGEVKQEEWLLSIQNIMCTAKVRPALSELLKQLMTFSNIPRNQVRFQKFLENSVKVHDKTLIKEAWEIINKAKEQQNNKPSNSKNGVEKSVSEVANKSNKNNERPNVEQHSHITNEEPLKKKHKSKKHKEANSTDQVNNKESTECNKNSVDTSSEIGTEQMVHKKHKKGKKKKGKETVQEERPNINTSMESEIENSSIVSNNDGNDTKKKFNWKKVIKAVLKASSDNEISLKKLQKKVLAEYYVRSGGQHLMSENELRATFHKKVTSNPKFRVNKERVKLVR